MIPVGENIQIVVAAHGLEAERICTTDALGQFWPKTLLLIPTPRLRHLKPGWQDRHDGADDGRDQRTANHKSSEVNSNSVRLPGYLRF
jgi:hypothetical protein